MSGLRRSLIGVAVALAMGEAARQVPGSRPGEDPLRGMPLADLELGPKGVQIRKGSASDPLRRHRKQHR